MTRIARGTGKGCWNVMKAIEVTATVSIDRTLTLKIPVDLAPGEHRVVVVIEEALTHPMAPTSFNLPTLSVGTWPENLSLRREDLYDDWGR